MELEIGIEGLPSEVRKTARIDPNGEVAWSRASAAKALSALADEGAVVLGLDLRRYGPDGGVYEVPWASFGRAENDADPVRSNHQLALAALHAADAEPDFDDLDWVHVTWDTPGGARP